LVLPCYCATSITELNTVFICAAATSGYVSVSVGAATGDSIAVALKTGVTGDIIPVAFGGVVKLISLGGGIAEGDCVISNTTPTSLTVLATYSAGQLIALRGINATGTICRLGTALQSGSATGDEILILIGRVP